MKKILVGIPVLYNGSVCLKAFKSVIDEADLLIIDNGSDADVKEVINKMLSEYQFTTRVNVIPYSKNIYVNPAWSVILEYFLESEYEQLVIINSDLIVQPGWSKYLEDNVWCIVNGGTYSVDTEVFEGIAGVFINFNKEMARLVYPLPESLKIWYGDTFIEKKFKKAGYKMIVKAGLLADHVHGGIVTVGQLPEFQEIIKQDMIEWETIKYTI